MVVGDVVKILVVDDGMRIRVVGDVVKILVVHDVVNIFVAGDVLKILVDDAMKIVCCC